MKIIECVPNFSTRCKRKATQIRKTIEAEDVKVLSGESDTDHNRTVITFIGDPKRVEAAAFEAVKKAAELIDLTKHKGVHPRIGATDVLPFIPLKKTTYKECIELAHRLGKKIAKELRIPIYFYEKAAKSPERKNLADTRHKEFFKHKPDAGKSHPTAGATMIGVRKILIAFNINLKTSDLKIAKEIAKEIREKDGGLPCVKALGLFLKSRNITQVSMNLTDYKITPPLKVFRTIERLAKKHGTSILESELIGLAPADSLPKNPKTTLMLNKEPTLLHFPNFSV